MKNPRFAFYFVDKDYHYLVGYKEIIFHLIFDVKMVLTRKTRYVAGGYLINPP